MSFAHPLMGVSAVLALVALLPSTAYAQDQTVDIDRFKLPSDHYGYVTTESAETLGHLQLGIGVWVNYANDPLVLADPTGERVNVVPGDDYAGPVESRVAGNAHLGIGITNYFSLSADLPLVMSQTGYDISSLDDLTEPPTVTPNALGDIRVVPKIAPVSRDDLPLGVALIVPVSLPTGDGTAYASEDGITVSPTLAIEFSDDSVWSRQYKWRAAANVGYALRPTDRIRDVATGNALIYRAAFGYRVIPQVELVADVHGESWGSQPSQMPLEFEIGAKGLLGRWTTLNGGFGLGAMPGVGTPDYRLYFGATFAPSFDVNARDTDKDKVSDGVDQCPKHSEDLDGYQDDDGCPELDNDGDGVEDGVDGCPNDPEDDDGHRDNDGCPELDNDNDNIPDLSDRCPDEAETINGFDDTDGCRDDKPVDDSDGDTYKDDVDRCPYDAEDLDNFEDTDGCPDSDNDKDGIADETDQCRDVKETYNGTDDEDGCPDEGRVQVKADRIEITEKIFFDTNKTTIKAESYSLLDEIAAVLKANPQITLIRIEGHTDGDGQEVANLKLSQGRAKAVQDYLVKAGVEASRLTYAGFGESMPIAPNDTEDGKAKNRRVEFIIVKQQ